MACEFTRSIHGKNVTFRFLEKSGLVTPDATCVDVAFENGHRHTSIQTMTKMQALRVMAVMANRLRSGFGVSLVGPNQTRLSLRRPDQYGLWPVNAWHRN